MFLTSFDIRFVFGYACFMCISCLKTAIWLVLGQGLAFLVKTDWQPCFQFLLVIIQHSNCPSVEEQQRASGVN